MRLVFHIWTGSVKCRQTFMKLSVWFYSLLMSGSNSVKCLIVGFILCFLFYFEIVCLHSCALSIALPQVCAIDSPPWCVSSVSNCLPAPCVFKACVPFVLRQIALSFPESSPALFPRESLVFDSLCLFVTEFACPMKWYLCLLVWSSGVDPFSD